MLTAPMLGIDSYWTGVVELSSGVSEERPFPRVRLRLSDADRSVFCSFRQQSSQRVLGFHTLGAFVLKVDTATGWLVAATGDSRVVPREMLTGSYEDYTIIE